MTLSRATDVASPGSRDAIAAWLLPVMTLAFQLATCAGYGYFRDELYYLANGEHLGFGYVEHPPLIGLIAALVRAMLGVFGVFTMNAFDMLAWAVLWWLVARYLRTGQERLWLPFGIVAGIGLENKISVLFLGFGIVAGLVVCRRWDAFRSRWLWIGGAIASLLFLPHVLWQIANGWPTLEFMRRAIAEKNVAFSPAGYVGAQALNTFPALPVWLAGLVFLLVGRAARPFRPLGWAYLAILGVMLTTTAKPDYLLPAYPVLFAAGGVALERWRPGRVGTLVGAAVVVFLVAGGVALAPFAKAILPVDTFVRYAHALGIEPPQGERQALGRLPQHFADMHGWPELVEAVAGVYRSLPPADQARVCIFARNYGQAGAIDLFGPRHGLPKAIARHNSYFLWGPRGCTGEVVIVIGGRRDDEVLSSFASVDLGATFTCTDCMPYENNKSIWIARGLSQPMSVVWPRIKRYI